MPFALPQPVLNQPIKIDWDNGEPCFKEKSKEEDAPVSGSVMDNSSSSCYCCCCCCCCSKSNRECACDNESKYCPSYVPKKSSEDDANDVDVVKVDDSIYKNIDKNSNDIENGNDND
eukprot:Awhi_evm1s12228